ncbi:MAG: recombinase family protein [Blautia sp.]|nr:recombinase family protein [Blautia sp.]
MEKKAAIYIRVSTDAQAEEGYSIDAQQEQLQAYCVARNIHPYDFYIDPGWSGSNLERPALQQMLSDIREEKISHCIVYKLDRLSRSQKDTLYIIEDILNPHRVEFISLHENLDTSTPMGRAMLGILSAFAQLERENIKLRTRMGLKERIKQGYWMGGGRVPFGFDYDKNTGVLVPNQDAEIVRQVYRLYLDGYSTQKIADMLGLKYDRLADQILQHKCNYGVMEYQGEEYPGRHKPIISKEVYDQAMAEKARRSMTGTTSTDHLLTGLVYCGKCGAKMRYQKWGKKGCKLICYSQQTSKQYLIRDPDCDQERFWAADVEREVLKKVFALKEKPADPASPAGTDIRSPLDILKESLSRQERVLKNLYNLYASSPTQALLDTISENEKKLKQIQKNIQAEQTTRSMQSRVDETVAMINSLQERWEHMSLKEKQSILRILVARVTITDHRIELQLNI